MAKRTLVCACVRSVHDASRRDVFSPQGTRGTGGRSAKEIDCMEAAIFTCVFRAFLCDCARARVIFFFLPFF